MLGLDARDLTRVRWSFTPPNGMNIGVNPVLSGRLLCFTDNVNTIAVYDLGTASNAQPTLRWTNSLSVATQDDHQFTPPVVANGLIYAAWWVFSKSFGYQQVWLVTANAADGSGFARSVVDNSLTYPGNEYEFNVLGDFQPLLRTISDGKQTHDYLYVNGGANLYQVDVAAPGTAAAYSLGGAFVSSRVTLADDVLWFGDSEGALHGLDSQLHAVPHTPAAVGERAAILTTPVIYSDPGGASAVIVSVTDTGHSGSLSLFDPSSGNVVSIPTGQTALAVLSEGATQGVVYAAGFAAVGTGFTPTQMFGFRVDRAVQELRDFIVDSQLLQDFDGQSTPSGVARYQTHLTLVDNYKAPLAREAVKLWADSPTTVRIGGQTFSIGPGDAQYAAAQTGTDGTLRIVSGNLASDRGDKPDMSAVPLRVWAAFMGPYERITPLPDREFHNRVASAHASQAGQSGADDPTRVNLLTAQGYGAIQKGGSASGKPLFTDDEKQQNQPQHVAQAIQAATSAIGTPSPSGGGPKQAAWSLNTTGAPGKYIAYADQPGSQYSPVNTAASRQVVVLQPSGLSYSRSDHKSAPPTYQQLTPASATLAIDALDGPDWASSPHATPRALAAAQAGTLHLGSWFGDFWDWLKGSVQKAVAVVTDVVVSVAEDVYLGIRVLVGDVASVFRTIINGIEEVASAIGSFFLQLGKLIEEIVEALSVLFHFEEIIKTQKIMLDELNRRITGIPGNANYPGLSAAVKTYAIPKLDAFLGRGEQVIGGYFSTLAGQIGGSSSVTQFQGQGATNHTVLSAQPKSGGPSSSQAVQGTWGMDKFKAGGSMPGLGAALQAPAGGTDPLEPLYSFITGFVARIGSDGDLASKLQSIKQGLQALGQSSSIDQFVSQAASDLIRAVGLLIESGLAIANAAFDGLLHAIDGVIALVFDPNTGIVNQTIEIPVLSWLYQQLTGENLTVANAITLVAAIPITVMWRVFEGEWPSQSLAGKFRARCSAAGNWASPRWWSPS